MTEKARSVRNILIAAMLKQGTSTRATARAFNLSQPSVVRINAQMRATADARAGICPWS